MKLTTVLPWILLALLLCAQAQDEVYKDPAASIQNRVNDLLSRMTLREKIGQMLMDIENTPENAPSIGAYMIGASDPPGDNSLAAWRLRQNQLHAVSSNQRLGIPILIAADAVHGQNILSGATIVPHNIGLGATRNPSLVRQVAQVTAEGCMSSALDMTFAPTIAVARTMTWGRTYESYSEDTDTVRSFVADFIEGLQGTTTPWNVIGNAKHWVGDGGTNRGTGTDGGIDAGDTTLSEDELLRIHGAPYIDAIKADVGSIMVSFSSVDGVQLHQHAHLITDVLKGDMGFQGFVLSDWEGYTRNDGDYDNQLLLAINAGVDMLMAPYQPYQIIDSVTNSTDYGLIDESRIDDAARRILTAKFKAGLFEKKLDPIDPDTYNPIGTTAHRAVARQAVRESLVLLKNDGKVLPQAKTAYILGRKEC
jgi:beta-glucosidase